MTSCENTQNFGVVLLYCDNDPHPPSREQLFHDVALDYYNTVQAAQDCTFLTAWDGNDYDTCITHFHCSSIEQENITCERLERFYRAYEDPDDREWYVFPLSKVHDMWMLKRFQEARKFDPVKNPPSALEQMAVLTYALENKPITFQPAPVVVEPIQDEEQKCLSPLDLYEGEEQTKENESSSESDCH